MPSRLASPPRVVQEQQRLAEREAATDWRAWYKTARWQQLRQDVLRRDSFTCRKTGVLLIGKHPAPNSPVVDHIKPHRGDEGLFWNIDNLQAVTKAWHDSVKQAIERADQVAAIHPKWLKPSIIPLTIVCGPPASGKSTFAQERAGPADIVIDLDRIAADISGEPLHGWDRTRWLNAALFRRNDMLGDLSRLGPFKAAWFIVAEPKAKHRAWWQSTLRPREIVVLETSEAECIRRVEADESRGEKATVDGIMKWWATYGRGWAERVIRTGFTDLEHHT